MKLENLSVCMCLLSLSSVAAERDHEPFIAMGTSAKSKEKNVPMDDSAAIRAQLRIWDAKRRTQLAPTPVAEESNVSDDEKDAPKDNFEDQLPFKMDEDD